MTLKEFRELTKDWPEDAKIEKWNTHYGWTWLSEVKLKNIEGKDYITLE